MYRIENGVRNIQMFIMYKISIHYEFFLFLYQQKEVSPESVLFSDETIDEKGCILIVGGMNPRDFRKDAGMKYFIVPFI